MLAVEAIGKAGAVVNEVVLAPLESDHLLELLTDTLHCPPERARPMAQLLHQKTGGNPFFAIQMLTSLAEERVVGFDPSTRSWQWDLERIADAGYSDNVVDLMVGRLQRLPEATLDCLKQFACLGHQANLATLRLICGREIAVDLAEAVRSGVISASGENYQLIHDRIQEAAYGLIPASQLAARHLAIGRLLLQRLDPEVVDERLFDAVDHLNDGQELMDWPEERQRLGRLNLLLARRARSAVAYAAARNYLEQSRRLSPQEEAFPILLELAECEWLVGNGERADQLFEEVFLLASSPLDQARVLRGAHAHLPERASPGGLCGGPAGPGVCWVSPFPRPTRTSRPPTWPSRRPSRTAWARVVSAPCRSSRWPATPRPS